VRFRQSALQGVIKSGCGLSSWKWGQECPQNPQAGKPALRVAQTFLSAGWGGFPVACPSPTFNHTLHFNTVIQKRRGNVFTGFPSGSQTVKRGTTKTVNPVSRLRLVSICNLPVRQLTNEGCGTNVARHV